MRMDCHYHTQQKVAIPKRARKNAEGDGRPCSLHRQTIALDSNDFTQNFLRDDGRIRLRQQVTLDDQEVS